VEISFLNRYLEILHKEVERLIRKISTLKNIPSTYIKLKVKTMNGIIEK